MINKDKTTVAPTPLTTKKITENHSNLKNKLIRKPYSYFVIVMLFIPHVNAQDIHNISHITNYVPTKETAIKIAEAVWLPIYGGKIYRSKPFTAYLKANSIWIVQGTLKEQKGGVPYIEIQKSDGKILKVIHGK